MLPLQAWVDLGAMAIKSSSITCVPPSDCLVSYPGHSLGESFLSFRDAVSVFYSLSWLSHRTLVGWESLSFLQRCSQCILQLKLTGLQDTRWRSLSLLQRCRQCILQPQLTRPQDTRWGVFHFCRDAVSVFYSPSRLGPFLGEDIKTRLNVKFIYISSKI